jgi:phosphatidylinositol alpha-1,6-mannosyltransferase
MVFSQSTVIQVIGGGSAVSEIIIRERPQIVQLATINDGPLGLFLDQWFKIPFVVYAHGNEILRALHGSWEKPRIALRLAARIFANSHFTRDLVCRANVDPAKVDIIHPGCDVERFQPRKANAEFRRRLLGNRDKDRVILTVGSLVARKGSDMVIRALPLVLQKIPNVTYLIVGNGPYRAQLEKLAVEMKVQDRVVFAGQVNNEDLCDVYAIGDVFIMPSREQQDLCDVEGFGIVFIEANACGLPVIGGRSGGISDAVLDGSTGLVVRPEDVNEIAQSLVTLLSNRELAARLGQQGRARAVEEFQWKAIADKVQGVLDSVVRERANGVSSAGLLP